MVHKYTQAGKTAFAVAIEVLEIVGFALGFVAIVQLPQGNMSSDLNHITGDWETSVAAVKDELNILVQSSIESRTLGLIAMVCIVLAFVLRTIVSRILRIPPDI
jgi:hypothetical protein